ncbi:hypothetical protein H6P81_016189 [Aristolochia fimbriata]|uniref:Uncharacterized protein n=1 Tax=Aristolochia fimbriata TaxID=158543 RepID=A0AAV7E9B7_ARIFI|nr:hypothetical protein H6P81_016189 [Aristolochia fimbriata]
MEGLGRGVCNPRKGNRCRVYEWKRCQTEERYRTRSFRGASQPRFCSRKVGEERDVRPRKDIDGVRTGKKSQNSSGEEGGLAVDLFGKEIRGGGRHHHGQQRRSISLSSLIALLLRQNGFYSPSSVGLQLVGWANEVHGAFAGVAACQRHCLGHLPPLVMLFLSLNKGNRECAEDSIRFLRKIRITVGKRGGLAVDLFGKERRIRIADSTSIQRRRGDEGRYWSGDDERRPVRFCSRWQK